MALEIHDDFRGADFWRAIFPILRVLVAVDRSAGVETLDANRSNDQQSP